MTHSTSQPVRGGVDSNNSTTATLLADAVFTGQASDVSAFSVITVMMDSNVDGTLSMQLSTDGTNWDRAKIVPLTIEIGSGSVHTLEVVSQFFRVVYTNGSTNQTHFRLQTICHVYKSGFLTSSPDQKISKVNDAQITRVSNDPYLDISRSLYADKQSFHRFGFNGTVPNGSFADIWDYGPTLGTYPWPTTAEKFRVKSGGNAADTSAGLGGRTIQIVYLDANGDQQQDQLTLAGTSASDQTTVAACRFIRAFVDTSGAYGASNTGEILIENVSAGQIVGTIGAGKGTSEMSMYTVPSGWTAYLTRVHVDVAAGANKDADIKFWQRPNALTTSAPFGAKRLLRQWTALQGEDTVKFEALQVLQPLTDLWIEAQGNGAATAVDIDYDLILVKDESPTVPQ